MTKSRMSGLSKLASGFKASALLNGKPAAQLAASAGKTPAAVFAGLEQLEQRQLLAAQISIGAGDVNPQTGLGTKTFDFEYYVHTYLRPEAGNATPTLINEEFDDEMDPWTTANPPAPPNGTFFDQSNIQISYSSVAATPVQLVQRPIGMNQVESALRVALTTTDRLNFTFHEPNAGTGNPVQRLVQTANVLISAAPGQGGSLLNTDINSGTRVELLRNGIVVATFRGAALANAGADAFSPIGTAARRYTFQLQSGFDTVRFSSSADAPNNSTYSDTFIIEEINTALPPNIFGESYDMRRVFARVTFTGPAGSSVELKDLYGRDIVPNLFTPEDTDVGSVFDPVNSGLLSANDGIGRVNIVGTNAQSSFTISGFVRGTDGNTFGIGSLDDLEDAGFGYGADDDGVIGLPEVQGSVVIGSPYVRDNTTIQSYLALNGATLVPDDFNRADQGVFINDGSSMGSVLVDGILLGSSVFSGALDRLSVGLMSGSARIDGDLGLFACASDAGLWVADEQNSNQDTQNRTGSRLNVGRTAREITIAGRNSMSISVLADVNSPTRARLNFVDFFSHENLVGGGNEGAVVQQNIALGANYTGRGNGIRGQAIPYMGGYFRNDDLSSAEFVGYNGTRVRVFGTINGTDAVNAAADSVDVYAFPADPSREVVIGAISSEGDFGGFTDILGRGLGYFRVVDRDGNVVAAIDGGRAGRGVDGNSGASSLIRFRPDRSDVYFLVLSVAPGQGVDFAYGFSITGMAPVTLGAVRSDSGLGGAAAPSTLALSAGSMGMVSIGTGHITSDGGLGIGVGINTVQGAEDLARWTAGSLSIPGNLYNVTTGFDIDGATIIVGGNLGTLATGSIARSVLNGDIYSITLRTGGTIGTLDIRGGLGVNQNPMGTDGLFGAVSIVSGTNINQRGDIGEILVGAYVSGGNVTISTGANAQIDKLLVGVNNDGAGSEHPGEIYGGIPTITTGVGADVRFMDFRRLSRAGDPDVRNVIGYNESITLVDDAGASVTISITGGDQLPQNAPPGTPLPTAGSQVTIRSLAINGSRGVAIASLDVVLRGGANLVITGTTVGVVSIGRIDIDSAYGAGGNPGPIDNQTKSNVLISGVAEIDIYEIRHEVGDLALIRNTTQGGDLVAVDALSLDTLTITGGNLGRTQVSQAGPRLLGPFRGIVSDGADVGGPLVVRADGINVPDAPGGADYDGMTTQLPIRPLDAAFWNGTPQSLEDIGSPIDLTLNGVVVRTGDLQTVTVSGTVGDVIVQSGHLITLTANSDNLTPQGAFHGIEGSIYAIAIGTVDIGDGLRGTGSSPFAAAGIFADQAIVLVRGTRSANVIVEGAILAAGVGPEGASDPLEQIGTVTPVDLPAPVLGIGTIQIANGRYDGALILAQALDDFWQSIRADDADAQGGNVGLVQGTNADLFASEIGGINVQAITLVNGDWDATYVNASENVGTITASNFRNSTRLGEGTEFLTSRILATRNIGSVIATGPTGDISDLTITGTASLTGQISARNIERLTVLINNVVNQVIATGDFRGNTIISGRIRNLNVTGSIRASELRVAGPIDSVTAGVEITQTEIQSTGPDGQIGTIRSQGFLQANVTSSGDIVAIESVNSNVSGRIETRNDVIRPKNGGIGTLRAGNDLLVDLSILGNAGLIFATRNIGTFGAVNPTLDIRGNLNNLTTQNGQNYSDLLVGQSVTGTITNGRVDMRSGFDRVSTAGILAFGRINAVVSSGDWAGDIISRSGGIGSVTINNGSFRPNGSIIANNGSLGTLTINAGDLLGDVLVDQSIGAITLNSGGGWRSQIGVSDFKRDFTRFQSDVRNQLPSGVQRTTGVDGVLIKAGANIDNITVNGGSIWETTIFAGGSVGTVRAQAFRNDTLTPGLNNAIAATTRIDNVVLGDFVGGLGIVAGVISLGADNRLGGTGVDADFVEQGAVGNVEFNGGRVTNSLVFAGIAPDVNGQYTLTGSKSSSGRSRIGNVSARGVVNNSQVFSDGFLGTVSPGFQIGDFRAVAAVEPGLMAPGNRFPSGDEVMLTAGVAFTIQTPTGERARVTLNGPGRAFWSASQNRVRLINTNPATSLSIFPVTGSTSLTDFRLLGGRNTALGTLNVVPGLLGNSSVYLDNVINNASFGFVNTTGTIGAGGDITNFSVNRLLRGDVRARVVQNFNVTGEFGGANAGTAAKAQFLLLNTLNVGGSIGGAISVDRDLTTVNVGTMNGGGIRSGASISTVVIGSMLNARVAARNAITSVNVAGDATGSTIIAGVDLGRDADFGGNDLNTDIVGAGSIGTVVVGGNFQRSDVAAGVSRGASGYVGADDAEVAAGRSSIGSVTIRGTLVGSTLNSEQFRVVSSGTVGAVTVGGVPFTGVGNFRVERRDAAAVAVRVTGITMVENARIYSVRIGFNQQVDFSTVSGALSIVELRNGGATTIVLAEGTDYTLSYDRDTAAVIVSFARSVTERNLPQQPGLPGPGVFQFSLSAAALRGSTNESRLDGNADGVVGDDWSRNIIVGDAGDKINAGNPGAAPQIDFYGAADLNLVLRASSTSGSVPETNIPINISGVIGDHPDTDPDIFRLGGDVDVYRVALRAGQILRLGEIGGVAIGAARGLFDAAGNAVGAASNVATTLPANAGELQFLIRQTGTYYLVVAGSLDNLAIADTDNINNVDVQPNAFGRYAFDITVIDDNDTGFLGDSASGTGAGIVYAPTPSVFAGADGVLGTSDDLARFTNGDWTFRLVRGSTSPGGADAVVTGTNSKGYLSERRSAPNGTFGTANDRITVRLSSSIGLPGSSGNPVDVSPDVDVFRLNDGQPIAAGTRMRITIGLTQQGANIGLAPENEIAALRAVFGLTGDLIGNVQFGLFETPAGTGFDDAKLVFAPSDFLPIGNQPAKTTTDGRTSYGYDANGNFFVDFIMPGALGTSGAPASYALVLQGAIRSDYTIDIAQQGTGSLTVQKQNILLETEGGSVDWLEAGEDIRTTISRYTTSVVGFAGQIDGVSADQYVLNSLVANLNAIFTAANLNVVISTTPATFQREQFSTVFLAGNVEPSAFFGNGQFGQSQHVDMLNADKTDQAVVYLSSLAELGFDASRQGVDLFVQALTAAVGRRIGELLGVRMEAPATAGGSISIMAANSPQLAGQGTYAFLNQTRDLSGPAGGDGNSVFYFGSQNSLQLLQKIVAPRV